MRHFVACQRVFCPSRLPRSVWQRFLLLVPRIEGRMSFPIVITRLQAKTTAGIMILDNAQYTTRKCLPQPVRNPVSRYPRCVSERAGIVWSGSGDGGRTGYLLS
jgi:hypothetical protein